MKKLIVIFSLLWMVQAVSASPLEDLKITVNQILSILKSKKSIAQKRKQISDIYRQKFDHRGLALVTLKRDWKYTLKKEADRKAFVKKYSDFILAFYLSKIGKFQNNKVVFQGETIKRKGKKAIVHTLMETNEHKMAKVDYFLAKRGNTWKVYDVEIEGIRISSTYRNQFVPILKKKGIEGLLSTLDKLIRKYKK
ncbi:MAG: ABC transporter substrate-binding protein [Candidatus Hydrogenedentota bacterium]|nr:MAG: ABC transporter substrate-binding protein [Candidatus Hydrogenedentota bacterium]